MQPYTPCLSLSLSSHRHQHPLDMSHIKRGDQKAEEAAKLSRKQKCKDSLARDSLGADCLYKMYHVLTSW